MTAGTLLRAARRSSGLGQQVLAERAQTSQPDVSAVERGRRTPTVDTLVRLLDSAGHKLIAVKTSHPDAVETSARIGDALRSGAVEAALRRFLDYSDGLAATSGVERVVLTAAEPYPSGSRVWDAALAAVAEYWLDQDGLPKPHWLNDPSRTLPSPQTLDVSIYDLPPRIDEVPPPFARRNVLVERGTLASI